MALKKKSEASKFLREFSVLKMKKNKSYFKGEDSEYNKMYETSSTLLFGSNL